MKIKKLYMVHGILETHGRTKYRHYFLNWSTGTCLYGVRLKMNKVNLYATFSGMQSLRERRHFSTLFLAPILEALRVRGCSLSGSRSTLQSRTAWGTFSPVRLPELYLPSSGACTRPGGLNLSESCLSAWRSDLSLVWYFTQFPLPFPFCTYGN